MKQFNALFLREFRCYFRSILAYVVFFIYLFSSIGTAFYFGSYLAVHETSMYSLFYAQPVILAVIIPALSMRLWSEEYRSGTAEFIFTQPIPIYCLVLAKYVAVFLFCCFMSLFLLPFIIYSSSWLFLDWQNIFVDYMGLWWVMALFCAIGCMVSALSKSVTISYLFSFFLAAICLILPFWGLYQTYNDFLFAEIGIPDIIYFVSLIGAFILINIEVIKSRQSVQRFRYLKLFIFISFVLLGIGLLNFAFLNFFEGKADLTRAKLYTPKQETESLLQKLQTPVSIEVFVAKDYINGNVDYFQYVQQIHRFLKRYKMISKGMVTVNVTYVDPYSELEENILEKGIYFETNNKGSRDYFGAVIRDANGQEMVIKQFLLQRRTFVEKDIDIALLKLIEPERVKTIGVYLDNTQNLEGFQSILLGLENDYEVFSVSSSMYEFSDKVDMIVLINPKRISPSLRYGLDQFVLKGGKLVTFFDFYTESQSDLTNDENLQFVDFLNNWHISLEPEMIDEGSLDKSFGKSLYKLHLNKASVFKIDNPSVEVKPFIVTDNNGMIGAVLEGDFISLYSKNPYENTEIFRSMQPFLIQSQKRGLVAVVGDVDLLEDSFWISDSSPDRNPYSVIETSGNGQAFRILIDYMLGNGIYETLPLNDRLLNRESISQKIKAHIYSRVEASYVALQNKIAEQKRLLFLGSDGDFTKFDQLLQVSQAGQKLAQDEKQLQEYEYDMKNRYSVKIIKIMLSQIVILPLILILILAVFLRWRYLYGNRKMGERYRV